MFYCALHRDHSGAKGGAGMNLSAFRVGDSIPTLIKPPVTKTQLVQYSGASGDFNPIHTVEEFANEVGLGGVIAHGMLTMAFLGQMLTDWVGLEGELEQFQVRFMGMVRPGDTVTCKGELREIVQLATEPATVALHCEIHAENQRREIVAQGTAKVRG